MSHERSKKQILVKEGLILSVFFSCFLIFLGVGILISLDGLYVHGFSNCYKYCPIHGVWKSISVRLLGSIVPMYLAALVTRLFYRVIVAKYAQGLKTGFERLRPALLRELIASFSCFALAYCVATGTNVLFHLRYSEYVIDQWNQTGTLVTGLIYAVIFRYLLTLRCLNKNQIIFFWIAWPLIPVFSFVSSMVLLRPKGSHDNLWVAWIFLDVVFPFLCIAGFLIYGLWNSMRLTKENEKL